MKCPPHVAEVQTFDNHYVVKLKKEDKVTEVGHLEKICNGCQIRIIVLSDRLNQIIERDKWEIIVEHKNG